jgi:HEAT repeat protein
MAQESVSARVAGREAGLTPRERVLAECRRRGRDLVAAGCADLLEGRSGRVDDALVAALGGEAAEYVLAGHEGGKTGYWPRVWAARGLLYAWDDSATAAIIHATRDSSWRVREMAARVVARHHVREAHQAMTELRADEIPRVRAAAGQALANMSKQP